MDPGPLAPPAEPGELELDEELFEVALAETLDNLASLRPADERAPSTELEATAPYLPVAAPDPEPDAEPLADPRLTDVDEWGRSEHMRALARRVYEPIYRPWFRAEWEGLEKIPTDGGALLVANHAGAMSMAKSDLA